MAPQAFRFPAEERFSCSNCTRCCRGWRVRVDAASVALLQAAGAGPMLQKQAAGWSTRRDDQGACSLLAPSGLCTVHPIKPAGCRLFPFRMVRTPDGIFVGASFVCPAVQANQGQPYEAGASEWTAHAAELPLVGDDPLPVSSGVSLDWGAYRWLEAELERELEGGAALLWLLSAASPGQHTAARLQAGWSAARAACEPPAEPWGELEHQWGHRLLAQTEGWSASAALSGAPVTFRCPSTGDWNGRLHELPRPAAPPLAGRYLRSLLFRKWLIIRRPLLHNLVLWQLAPRLLSWWAALHAAGRGQTQADEAAWSWALDRCESEVITHAPVARWSNELEAAARHCRWVAGGIQ